MASNISSTDPIRFLIAIHLVLARRIMVTHFDMDLNPVVPIRELKEELVTQLGIPASQQMWFFRNVLLNDQRSLEFAGVVNDSIVEVRPMPSMGAAASPSHMSVAASNMEQSREV